MTTSKTASGAANKLLIALAMSGAISGQVAISQESTPARPITDESDTADRRLDDVVVTATRRETKLQDTPLSITALQTGDLLRQGIENFDDFARQVPGVVLTGDRNFGKFNIRGIETSATTSSIGNQRSVTVYFDEVPMSSSSVVTPDLRLYDVDRVEILRGPQGTSFGSGSLSGAVRVIPNKASTEGFDASIRADLAFTDDGGLRQRYNGMLNLPVSDTFALRAVGYLVEDEGYVDTLSAFPLVPVTDAPESQEWGGRLSARWTPTDALSATFVYMHDDIKGPAGSAQQLSLGRNTRGTIIDQLPVIESDIYNFVLDYDLDWARLVSSTTYAQTVTDWSVDLDAIFGAFLPFGYGESQEHDVNVQEIRLVSNDEKALKWLIGAYYFKRESDVAGASFIPEAFVQALGIDVSAIPLIHAPGVNVDGNRRAFENMERAVFGELTHDISETLSATVGVRYTEFESEDGISDQGFVSDLLPLIFAGQGGSASAFPDQPVQLSTGKRTSTTTRFVLNWEPSYNQTYYVSASQGFRRPHPNFVSLTPNTVNPADPTTIPQIAESDSLWNYELGAKSSWFDGRVRANIAAYFIEWKDIQLTATRASDAVPYATNGGDVESIGIEAELLFFPSKGLELGANFTLASAEVVSISEADSIASGLVLGAPLVMPKHQIAGFAQKTWALPNDAAVFVRVDAQHVGDYPNAPPNLPGFVPSTPNPNFATTDAYTNANLQVGWQNDEISVVLYAENVFNNDDFVFINPDLFSESRFLTLRPRTFGVRLGWQY
jgi:outer membrane receptor protein involved in Fe transport